MNKKRLEKSECGKISEENKEKLKEYEESYCNSRKVEKLKQKYQIYYLD